jgi:hypothetical protein
MDHELIIPQEVEFSSFTYIDIEWCCKLRQKCEVKYNITHVVNIHEIYTILIVLIHYFSTCLIPALSRDEIQTAIGQTTFLKREEELDRRFFRPSLLRGLMGEMHMIPVCLAVW